MIVINRLIVIDKWYLQVLNMFHQPGTPRVQIRYSFLQLTTDSETFLAIQDSRPTHWTPGI